jgi:3-oxoacyl-[acyl-carrier protein] reductase
MMRSEATEPWLDQLAKQHQLDRADALTFALTHVMKQTVKKMGEASDLAHAIAFLCSPKADFINGANIRIDGGASPATN